MNWQLRATAVAGSAADLQKVLLNWQGWLLKEPCVVLLSGALGVGKTELVKQFCLLNGVTDVASPSYSIHHHYRKGSIDIDHFDLYRIESDQDLESTGFWDLLNQSQGWVFIEWPERLKESEIPKLRGLYKVELSLLEDQSRRAELWQQI